MILAPVLAAAVVAGAPVCRPSPPQLEDAAWLARHCQVLTAADARVARAERILAQLVRLRRFAPTLTLLVLGDLRGPQAYITRTGTIVLSRRALELCLDGLGADDGDANLAFVLAHELAHWTHEDRLWTAGQGDDDLFEFAVREQEATEIKADAAAIVDITRAGFDPRVVLRGGLLRRWATQDGAATWYAQRKKHLAAQADLVTARLPLFEAGTLFLMAGRHEVAAALLVAFVKQASYEGREVLADIGFAELQLAFEALVACDARAARRFVVPAVIDTHTRAARLRGAGDASVCRDDGTFRASIDAALGHLQRAVDADADYVPARLNRLSALLLAGDVTGALSAADPAQWPRVPLSESERRALDNARVVALYLFGEQSESQDLRRKALAELRDLAVGAPDDVAATYNLARMLAELDKPSESAQAWQRVLALRPPAPLAEEARRMTGQATAHPRSDALGNGDTTPTCVAAESPPLPVPLGTIDRKRRPTLPRPSRGSPFAVHDLGKLYVYSQPAVTKPAPSPAWMAYAVETEFSPAAVVLVVQDLDPPVALAALRERQDTELADVPLADGRRVLHYDGCAYVVAGEQAVRRIVFQMDP